MPFAKTTHPLSPVHAAIGVGTARIGPRHIEYVNDVLKTGRLSYGPYTQEFERRFAAAHGCRFAIMTNSGTSSLMIALYALKLARGWADGDEVIVPAVTFVATANVVIQLNLKPVFVDVDPIYYELDPAKLEAAVTPRTRCVIPVHLFGSPCEMAGIQEVCSRHGLAIIEDSCETMFTAYRGKPVGSFGEIGCFSTYVAHLLCTGVGGLCTTNDPALAVSLRSLANHGRDSIYLSIDDDDGKSADEIRMIIPRRFSFVTLGYSFRPTEMEGALGLAEFEGHEEMLRRRRENALGLTERLRDLEGVIQLPSVRPEAGHAFMMYPVVLRSGPKAAVVEYLESRGVETRDMLPLVNQPVYRRLLGTREEDTPVARWINESGFYIGCHQDLGPRDLDYVSGVFHEFLLAKTRDRRRACLVVLSRFVPPVDPLILRTIVDSLRLSAFDEHVLADASGDPAVRREFETAGFRVVSGGRHKAELLAAAVGSSSAELFVVIGADASDEPRDATLMLGELRSGADLAVASRFMPGGGRWTARSLAYRSLGNRAFSFLLSVLFGRNVSDANNHLRGFTRRAFERMRLTGSGDGVMFAMTVEALNGGFPYVERPTVERPSAISTRSTNRPLMAIRFVRLLVRYLIGGAFRRRGRD